MSADNGIYILETKHNEFRVLHTQCIDNIYWWKTKSGKWERREQINPAILKKYFGKCSVYDNRVDANKKAIDLWEEIMNSEVPIVEYGIQDIRLPNLEFPNGRH